MVGLLARSQICTLKDSSITCSCPTAALLPWALVAVNLTRQRQSPVYSALRPGKNIRAAGIFLRPDDDTPETGHARGDRERACEREGPDRWFPR